MELGVVIGAGIHRSQSLEGWQLHRFFVWQTLRASQRVGRLVAKGLSFVGFVGEAVPLAVVGAVRRRLPPNDGRGRTRGERLEGFGRCRHSGGVLPGGERLGPRWYMCLRVHPNAGMDEAGDAVGNYQNWQETSRSLG